jgi:hypothetical protein
MFGTADGKNDLWINGDLVGYVRPTVKGEPGQTFIWCEGSGVFVKAAPEEVIEALRSGSR